jgi:cyclopropane fatty-acyl-phospholipid synthase-like methyltransferase
MVKIDSIDIPLNPVPAEFEAEYRELMSNAWLVNKINRGERIKEKQRYIERFLPKIKAGGLNIIDIGTGPGEFLEVAQHYGCSAIGFDNCRRPISSVDTFFSYNRFSIINHKRQKLNVVYTDFNDVMTHDHGKFVDKKYDIINCQHALNLIFETHFVPKVTNDGHWILTEELSATFDKLFSFFRSILVPGGAVMIAALCATNKDEYSRRIKAAAQRNGFELEFEERELNHKFRGPRV